MNNSLYMLRCSSRSYLVRYTVILITSRDCSHITWSRNPASVPLLATLQKKKLFKIMNSKKYKTRHSTILISLYENVEKFLRFADTFILMIRTKFFSSEVFLRTYRRKIEKDIRKSLILSSFLENNSLIFYKNISTRNICDCWKQMSNWKRFDNWTNNRWLIWLSISIA
jgi:hypothetical protein